VNKANPAQHFTEGRGFLAKGGQRLTFFCFFSLVKQRKEGDKSR